MFESPTVIVFDRPGLPKKQIVAPQISVVEPVGQSLLNKMSTEIARTRLLC